MIYHGIRLNRIGCGVVQVEYWSLGQSVRPGQLRRSVRILEALVSCLLNPRLVEPPQAMESVVELGRRQGSKAGCFRANLGDLAFSLGLKPHFMSVGLDRRYDNSVLYARKC